MKRLIGLFILAFTMTILLLACGGGGESSNVCSGLTDDAGSRDTPISGIWSGNDDAGSVSINFCPNGTCFGSGSGSRTLSGRYYVSGSTVNASYTTNACSTPGTILATVSGNISSSGHYVAGSTIGGTFSDGCGHTREFTITKE